MHNYPSAEVAQKGVKTSTPKHALRNPIDPRGWLHPLLYDSRSSNQMNALKLLLSPKYKSDRGFLR